MLPGIIRREIPSYLWFPDFDVKRFVVDIGPWQLALLLRRLSTEGVSPVCLR